MARVLVIGYGNPLRGDDGLGWHAVQALAQTQWDDRVELLSPQQLTIELAAPISSAHCVIFIDASIGGEPGTLSIRPVTADEAAGNPTTHHLSPSALLTLARQLFGSSPPATVLGIHVAALDFAETLSEPVQAAMPALLARVRELIAEQLQPP